MDLRIQRLISGLFIVFAVIGAVELFAAPTILGRPWGSIGTRG